MKRMSNLYPNICNMNNIIKTFNEVCRNTKNKQKVARVKEYQCMFISDIHKILTSKTYTPGPTNVFIIKDPKTRRIVSQNMQDKVVNHLVSRYILYPAILPCLLDVNVASRTGLGTSAGVSLALEYHRKCKINFGKYYILKCDISKFFYSIDHEILKKKIRRRIKDPDALNIIDLIIDSEPNGLGIGSMSNQVFAIFFLNDLDHYIKEDLKIKYLVRYQDDFLLFHESKEYLKECLEKITIFLKKEKLSLNAKTRIYSSSDNFLFLGRNPSGRYCRYRNIKRKIKKRYHQYTTGDVNLNSLISSVSCYRNLCKRDIKFFKR